uniref:C2H2-type domain-containing protein n=1 Tax=Cucumis melo TaxID=3656 RepID=A0A9I9EDH1_CUCME
MESSSSSNTNKEEKSSNTNKGEKGSNNNDPPSPNRVICHLCGNNIPEKSFLKHQSRHTGKFHTCKSCLLKFQSKCDLWRHQDENKHK